MPTTTTHGAIQKAAMLRGRHGLSMNISEKCNTLHKKMQTHVCVFPTQNSQQNKNRLFGNFEANAKIAHKLECTFLNRSKNDLYKDLIFINF